MLENDEKYRILLVDDEEEFLTASSKALLRRNLDVDIAPNGVTALELVDKYQYDVIVMDVKMPDIDGIEVFRLIREKHPGLPVILLTGHATIKDAFYTSKDGIADYLSKPVDMDHLAKLVFKVVAKWREKSEDGAEIAETTDSLVPVRIMLIDDEVEFLKSMRRILERRNMEVFIAESGEQGLADLSAALVDVVVLDVKMPGMSGLEVLKRIRSDFPSVQVIILTGHPSHDAAMEAIKLGAHEYLEKPQDVNQLAATIHSLFKYRQRYLEQQQQELIERIRKRYPD